MQTDLQRLAALIDGWSQTDQIPDVERDLALQKLRDLYEAIRFAGPGAVQAKEVSAEAVPEVPEEDTPDVSAPVKTGDETNLMLYLIIGGVAILVLAGTGGYLLYKRRHNKNS